jgi:hypothetical protein
MSERYVRTFRVFTRIWEANETSLEVDDDGKFRSVHEIVNGHLSELQEHGLNAIISVHSQDTRLDDKYLMTNYTVVYEEQS